MKRHWDLRGMGMAEIMATSSVAFDEVFEQMIDNAGNLCRNHGGTEDEVKAARELQRQLLEEGRAGHLAELRGWLERDGKTLQ